MMKKEPGIWETSEWKKNMNGIIPVKCMFRWNGNVLIRKGTSSYKLLKKIFHGIKPICVTNTSKNKRTQVVLVRIFIVSMLMLISNQQTHYGTLLRRFDWNRVDQADALSSALELSSPDSLDPLSQKSRPLVFFPFVSSSSVSLDAHHRFACVAKNLRSTSGTSGIKLVSQQNFFTKLLAICDWPTMLLLTEICFPSLVFWIALDCHT